MLHCPFSNLEIWLSFIIFFNLEIILTIGSTLITDISSSSLNAWNVVLIIDSIASTKTSTSFNPLSEKWAFLSFISSIRNEIFIQWSPILSKSPTEFNNSDTTLFPSPGSCFASIFKMYELKTLSHLSIKSSFFLASSNNLISKCLMSSHAIL